MNDIIERQRHIEKALEEEFRAGGHQVVVEDGNLIALVETLRLPGLTEFEKVDLSQLAEQIERRLYP